MNISHFISSIDIKSGGPSVSVTNLCQYLNKKNQDISLYTINSNENISNYKNFDFKINYLDEREKSLIKINNPILLNNNTIDLLHIHGIWEPIPHRASLTARKTRKPYIITPRGMLAPWDLKQYRLKKQIAMSFYQKKDLNRASYLQATSLQEADDIKKLNLKPPVAIVPNGIDISLFPHKKNNDKDTKQALFLSRIHPTKGIEYLINAWAKVATHNNWELNIIGNGEQLYIKTLQKQIHSLGLSKSVNILPPKFNKEKIEAYHNADLFILPTHTENFGLVIAEALACGTPVITTKGTPWQELKTNHCGWWIDIGVESLVKALKEALTLSQKELFEMGVNGRKLIQEKYTMEVVAKQMIELYKSIL